MAVALFAANRLPVALGNPCLFGDLPPFRIYVCLRPGNGPKIPYLFRPIFRSFHTGYPDNYETLSTDAALRAERIACRLRHLIYSSTTIRKGDYLKSASVMHGITITYENEVLAVTLPSLLPKRRQRQSAEFLLDPLYFALEQYAKENTLPHYRECVVCFAQVYDQALPTRRVRDYDNLEEKQILDLLSSFVMADDTGLLCDAYNTAELGEQDCTMIFVMEKHRFPGWLAEHKSSLKSISDF